MSFGEDDASRLLTAVLERPPEPGEARAIAEQVERARRHAVATNLAGTGELFTVETHAHAATLRSLAQGGDR
mgnify:CR=1 FL=1